MNVPGKETTMAVAAAKGTKFVVGGASGNTVGHCSSIGSPQVSTDEIETTALDNESGWKEFIASFKDGGEVSIEGFLDGEDAGQLAMIEALNSGEITDFAINFPDKIKVKWTFKGFVKAFNTSAETTDAVKFSATIRVSGKPMLDKAA